MTDKLENAYRVTWDHRADFPRIEESYAILMRVIDRKELVLPILNEVIEGGGTQYYREVYAEKGD